MRKIGEYTTEADLAAAMTLPLSESNQIEYENARYRFGKHSVRKAHLYVFGESTYAIIYEAEDGKFVYGEMAYGAELWAETLAEAEKAIQEEV
jgi:hypothetical protein